MFYGANCSVTEKNSPRRILTAAPQNLPPAPLDYAAFTGKTEGNTYTNDFFGIKIKLPESWVIADRDINKAIQQRGSEMKGKTAANDKALTEAEKRLTIHLTASKDIIGHSDNASLVLATERKPPLVQIRDGRDYLRLMLATNKMVTMPADYKISETIES